LLERLKAALGDRYAVESEIGHGGMATVFLAEDLRHDRRVAIKVLHPELAASLGTDRFLREIKIAAGLEHPHILPLHDSGEADGLLYYVMPYVEGESLRERLEREGQLPIEQALSIADEVADGLAYAHEHGVVHRDIKPGNILLSAGHARIADFGVARAVGVASEGEHTATGLAVGTPKYMSPEQASAGEVDGRSDIYSLGCVLWEMLAGEPPWDAPTPRAILARKTAETTPDLRVRRKTVPADLEAVIARAMAPAPADRFSTAEEFAAALKAPASVGRESRRALRRLAGAGMAIVLLAAGIWLTWLATRAETAEEAAREPDPDAIAVLPFQVTGTSDALRTLAGDIPRLFWMKVTGEHGPRTVDPPAVTRLWAAAGGSIEEPLAEVQAVEIAQAAGAGRLVHGVVAGTEANMSISATLLEVPSGRVRVRRMSVEGPYEDYIALADALINRLLVSDLGSDTDLSDLTGRPPAAVLAYLAGDLDEALALDSTFVLAALLKYERNEGDVEAARFVWERQDQLSPRDRAATRALMGWRFGETRTLAQRFAQYDSIGEQDWERADLSWQLWVWGRLAGIPRYRERAKAAILHFQEQGWDGPWGRMVLSDIAAEEGDTAAMVLYSEGIDTHATDPGGAVIAVAVRLRVALMQGDTAAVESLWEEAAVAGDSALGWLEPLLILLVDGRGLDGLDRFMLSEEEARPGARRIAAGTGLAWARARGRYPDWKAIRDSKFDRFDRNLNPLSMPVYRIREALFLGEPEDSTVLAAAAWMDSLSAGTIALDPLTNDPEPETRYRALAHCWSTLWKVAHGDTAGAPEALRYLREDVPLPYRYSVCAGLIEVLVAEQEGGDLQAAVSRLDSIVRPVPMEMPLGYTPRDGTGWIDNLFLSRRLVQVGDTVAALAAARRAKPWTGFLTELTLGTMVDLLREEARLTAMVGDSAGAIDAYQHYFMLRDFRPDHPPWAAQWDSMRVEYGTLTGVEGP
ncbi:MAG: serine/threonine protein kinase, partial [Gemmatimonadetes bacterium]|nr:serine/threonine protein kinase [Gemmatimonadota bacterium]